MARRARCDSRVSLDAGCGDLSDHLLDCRGRISDFVFRVNVRGLVWVAPEARLASQPASSLAIAVKGDNTLKSSLPSGDISELIFGNSNSGPTSVAPSNGTMFRRYSTAALPPRSPGEQPNTPMRRPIRQCLAKGRDAQSTRFFNPPGRL